MTAQLSVQAAQLSAHVQGCARVGERTNTKLDQVGEKLDRVCSRLDIMEGIAAGKAQVWTLTRWLVAQGPNMIPLIAIALAAAVFHSHIRFDP